jgi:hypothetical protein
MRTILIILTIYMALRVFFKYILPSLLGMAINKVAENARQQSSNHNTGSKPEGHVEVNYKPNQQSKVDGGEYVDYEEIK